MSYMDLLDRMSSNDTEAFLEMTDRYGWAVYSAIRKQHADHAVADRIYNDTMNAFYHSLSDSNAEDPMEALLCSFADLISEKQIASDRARLDQLVLTKHDAPPEIQLYEQREFREPSRRTVTKKSHFWYNLGVIVVLMAIFAVLWCIIGLLMDMNLIPYYDLGYSWFNANIMQLF